jgi:hypothetical protein
MARLRTTQKRLQKLWGSSRGRITVLTGARQVGKTTLVTNAFPGVPLLRFDALTERLAYRSLTPADWIERFPVAILDEVQKAPELFDTLKSVFDQAPETRYLLLGSSQIQLLDGVRETLAGRAALMRLHPLTLPELMDEGGSMPCSSFQRLLTDSDSLPEREKELFDPVAAISPREASARRWWDHLARWGGMPSLIATDFDDAERMDWLRDYQELYLQRDLGDLARLSDLEPFVRAQKIAALRSGETVQFAALGAAAGVGATTARRYLQYLELSFQIHMLQPWFRNAQKRLARTPKLHFLDNGIRRGILRRTGDIDGHEMESVVVSECIKQAALTRTGAEFHHLRTADGREVDLLLEMDKGYYAFEIKLAEHVVEGDARHLRDLGAILDKPLLAGFVLSSDSRARRLADGAAGEPILAVPAWRFLS